MSNLSNSNQLKRSIRTVLVTAGLTFVLAACQSMKPHIKGGVTLASSLVPANSQVTLPDNHLPDELAKDPGWIASIESQISDKEYFISRNSQGLQAPNRAHNLRTYFSKQGIEIKSRTGDNKQSLLAMQFVGLSRESAQVVASSNTTQLTYRNNRVELNHGKGINEWFINNSKGLEHGFDLATALVGKGLLNLTLNVSIGQVTQNGDDLKIRLADGRKVDYSHLIVLDANQKTLPAKMFRLADNQIQIQLDDADATYPLIIDPLISNEADAELIGSQDGAQFGIEVSGAGDVNGDGFADVIVGAHNYDNGGSNTGAAFLYYGSENGIRTSGVQIGRDLVIPAESNFGRSVSGAGDVNGDGFADIIIGAPDTNGDFGGAYVFHGSANGINENQQSEVVLGLFLASDNGFIDSNFGFSVADAGDVNGDGYPDVIVGGYLFDSDSFTDEGIAVIYYGSANGIIADYKLGTVLSKTSATDSRFGFSVASAGDVNGDGLADVIVGSPRHRNSNDLVFYNGAAFVFHGHTDRNSIVENIYLSSDQTRDLFGVSVASAGDVNGDGYSDIIIGASEYDNGQTDEGAAFIYHGSATGIVNEIKTQLEIDKVAAAYGRSVDSAGDINGDGYADVIVGAKYFDNNNSHLKEGAFYVYLGSESGIDTNVFSTKDGDQSGAQLGFSVAAAGDVNGDGYSDVIVGAFDFDDNGSQTRNGSDEGAAYIYHGGASGISSRINAELLGNQDDSRFGWSVSTAGDVNGDGFDDVIVGIPKFDIGSMDEGAAFLYLGSLAGISNIASLQLEGENEGDEFGYSVSTAGDVNGDGYSDVIVGAPRWNGDSQENRLTGAVYFFYGSVNGINSVASTRLDINSNIAKFGYSVASAGDVNADGFDDVIIGAENYSKDYDGSGQTQEGAAFVYHGSATGINTSYHTLLEIDQADGSYRFGESVSSAGDVNGDGYADVIVGNSGFESGENNEGAIFVFHGGAEGVNPIESFRFEGNQVNARVGKDVSYAGDVNGDGYGDIIFGGFGVENNLEREGAAFIYYGSSIGITADAKTQLERNKARLAFGWAVSNAGDINGDGFDDVIVGSNGWEDRPGGGNDTVGTAYIYHGSASGIKTTSSALLQSDQSQPIFSGSLSAAGDVNGDGYADIIAGAYLYTNSGSNEGAAFVYLGNSAGKPNFIQQTNATNQIIADGLYSQSRDQLTVSMIAHSTSGREKVKLQIETCAFGIAFADVSCVITTGTSWTDTGASGDISSAALSENVSGLTANTYYRWRARILHLPFTATTAGITQSANPEFGPWYRLNANNDSADFKTRNYNSLPTGTLAIFGAPLETLLLVVANTLEDENDLGDFSYTWQRDGIDVGTGFIYPLSADDVGAVFTLVASYIDGDGYTESVVSAATDTVIAYNDNDDYDNDGLTNAEELALGTDLTDPDTDNDGVLDGEDDFPLDQNEWLDSDGDGIGDNSDPTPYPAGNVQLSAAEYQGNEAIGLLTITVVRTEISSGELTVDYALQDGSAVAGMDYEFQAGTLNFADGEIEKTIDVQILDDLVYEGDENFSLTLSNIQGDTSSEILDNDVATITILENEAIPPAGEIALQLATIMVNENDINLSVLVTRTGGSFAEVRVSYVTADGTAMTGEDYTMASGTLVFADGETEKTINLELLDDNNFEADENFSLNLTNTTGGASLGQSEMVITILDDEPTPPPGVLSIENATYNVLENTATLDVNVVRLGGSAGEVSVDVSTINNSAIAGEDYQLFNQTLVFADAETEKNITLNLIDDVIFEGDEDFNLRLSNVIGASLGSQSNSVVTIIEDDAVPPAGVFQFSGANYFASESESSLLLTVTRTNGSFGQVSLDVSTADATATAGEDYMALTQTLIFVDGEISQTVNIVIFADDTFEIDETFNLSLSNLVGDGVVGNPATAKVTITNDDPVPTSGSLAFSGATYSANESDNGITITVQRNEGSLGDISVDYAITDGSATSGNDYSSADGTLFFADGVISQTFDITLIDDDINEPVETINLALSNPTRSMLGNQSIAVVNIEDNDESPVVTPPAVETSSGGGGSMALWLLACLIFVRLKIVT